MPNIIKPISAAICICALSISNVVAQAIDKQQLANVVDKALATFDTPGMSVGVVHKGEVVHLQGYGKKQFDQSAGVNSDTLFRLASTSKAFTAASLAILVDEEKLNWNDKVIDHLPSFRMHDMYATREMTIRDLLVHRSGLGSGQGDSMLWPEPSGFTREEIIENLRYLTPQFSFRHNYAYSNVMYITAGEIVAKITGMSWEEFVNKRILSPLNMGCFAGDVPDDFLVNIAMPHGERDGELYLIPRNGILGTATVSAAAGGMVCSARGMTQWIKLLLNGGRYNENEQIFTESRLKEMWTSHTILRFSEQDEEWDNTHFHTYGLGWRMSDVHGYQVISHTGTLSGMQAYIALVPELELGIVLLNNGSNSGARSSVMQTLLKHYMPNAEKKDWVAEIKQLRDENRAKYLAKRKIPQGSGKVNMSSLAYTGEFEDKWFGKVVIKDVEGKLRIAVDKMVNLKGTLEPFEDHSFVVRWDNKNAANDAFIHFKTNVSQEVISFTMHPFRVDERQNHEYRDMHFMKHIEEATD